MTVALGIGLGLLAIATIAVLADSAIRILDAAGMVGPEC